TAILSELGRRKLSASTPRHVTVVNTANVNSIWKSKKNMTHATSALERRRVHQRQAKNSGRCQVRYRFPYHSNTPRKSDARKVRRNTAASGNRGRRKSW